MSASEVLRLGLDGRAHSRRRPGPHNVRGICLLIAVMLLGVLGLAPAAAATPGSISGTITDPGSLSPKVNVTAVPTGGGGSTSVCASSNGSYTIDGLSPGTYYVSFGNGGTACVTGEPYATQYYKAKTFFQQSSWTTVTVTDGVDTPDIDATMQAGGAISGTVTDATTSDPVENIGVMVHSGSVEQSGCTKADGSYVVGGLPAGTYTVEFGGGCGGPTYAPQWYYHKGAAATADLVTVALGKPTPNINAALGGSITGTVTRASTTTTLGLVAVDVYDSTGKVVADTCTASNGTYSIVGLATGSYRVRFSNECGAGNYLTQFYDGKSSLATAKPLAITPATVVTANAAMVVGGQITGTVRSGNPYPWTPVRASVDLYNSSGTVIASTCSAADGKYSFSALTAGTYYVRFSTGCGGGNYVTQFYSGKPSIGVANAVYVVLGSTRSGVDAYMTPASYPPWPYSAISGTVTDVTTSAPIGAIAVNVYGTDGSVVRATCTAADGTYSAGGLSQGTYRVGFSSSGCGSANSYVTQFYSGKPSLAAADSVYGWAGLTTYWINAALLRIPPVQTGQMSGAVTDAATHAAIGGVSVSVYGSAGNVVQTVKTDSHGHYSITGLSPGSYRVGFTEKGYVAEFYNNKSTLPKADGVTVLSGSTTQWVDAALTLAPIAPGNTLAPAINGSAAVGQWLFVSSGKWTGTAPLSYRYQWQRCTASCSNITGASESAYKPITADVGAKLRVVVTASNAAGHASATSNQVGPIPALSPSAAQIKTAMLAQLWPKGYSADIHSLLHNGAYIYKFSAKVRGKLVISWYYLPKGAHLSAVKGPKPVLVARGQTVYSKAGKANVKVTLTTAGKKLLRTSKRVKITCQGSFTPTGKSAVIAVKTFTLKH